MSKFVRASAPAKANDDQLGPLAELPGSWSGDGFNLIALPVPDPRNQVPGQAERLS